MTQYLPPNLLALFAPRDPVPYLPPPDKLPHEKKTRGYIGVGQFLNNFEVSILEFSHFIVLTIYFVTKWGFTLKYDFKNVWFIKVAMCH